MSMLKEFKTFAMKGNVVDLAVGIIIGAAFGKIVSSLVADILMPPLGILIGGVNFTGLKIVLKSAVIDSAGRITSDAVTLNYGNLVQTIFDFAIVAFAIFLLIKALNRMKMAEEEKPKVPSKPSDEVVLLSEIRDLLKK
jgi:large conductance mechanosensitive channel